MCYIINPMLINGWIYLFIFFKKDDDNIVLGLKILTEAEIQKK